MSDSTFTLEVDGHSYRVPDDLTLNDVVALEEAGLSLGDESMTSIRFVLWRLMRRHDPDITLEEAGDKVPLGVFSQKEEEGPPPIPLHGPDRPNGSSGDPDSSHGSHEANEAPLTSGVTGPR